MLTIISKSDATGGAAVAAFRLMEALRADGLDARMLVTEKKSDSPYVKEVGGLRYKLIFLLERFHIFLINGFNRKTLFKIDTGLLGLPLWRHPWVKEADAVLLHWINQGMLSLKGIGKIKSLGKPIVWTMHDMWPFAGICHHAGLCGRYEKDCGDCPLLHDGQTNHKSPHDMSYLIWRRKKRLYADSDIRFVAVSSWVREKAAKSSLLADRQVYVVPNPFPVEKVGEEVNSRNNRILFGAAGLDDPVKDLPTFIRAMNLLFDEHPEMMSDWEVVFFGGMKNPELLKSARFSWQYRGQISDFKELEVLYKESGIVVSSSVYETSGNTLVEGQALGCIPVSFNQGGQVDIINHLQDGYLADWNENQEVRVRNLADGILWAMGQSDEIRERMRSNVEKKFYFRAVAERYRELISLK